MHDDIHKDQPQIGKLHITAATTIEPYRHTNIHKYIHMLVHRGKHITHVWGEYHNLYNNNDSVNTDMCMNGKISVGVLLLLHSFVHICKIFSLGNCMRSICSCTHVYVFSTVWVGNQTHTLTHTYSIQSVFQLESLPPIPCHYHVCQHVRVCMYAYIHVHVHYERMNEMER